jgi:hypothetical protein
VKFGRGPRAFPRALAVYEIEACRRLPETGVNQPSVKALTEQLLRGIVKIKPAWCQLAGIEGDSLHEDNLGEN